MWLARSEHVIRLSGSGSVPKFNFIPKTPIIHHKILIHLLSYVSIAQCSNVNIMSLFNSLINLQRYLTENISFSHFVLTTIASKGSVYLFTVQSRDNVFPILIMKPFDSRLTGNLIYTAITEYVLQFMHLTQVYT